jgi:hypothetical protein
MKYRAEVVLLIEAPDLPGANQVAAVAREIIEGAAEAGSFVNPPIGVSVGDVAEVAENRLPTPAEQMARYEIAKTEYDRAHTLWDQSGRTGNPPPRPVRPHTPGWPAPKPSSES